MEKNESPQQTTEEDQKTPHGAAAQASGWRKYGQEIRFLVLFLVILGGSFTLLSLQPVNDGVIVPFTAKIADASGATLNLIGEGITMDGTIIANERFAVNIKNGCNGVEAMVILLAAIIAFPASWKARVIGLVLGVAVIQAVNLIRVVALFLTGAYLPELFDSSHTVIWQSIVILSAVLLWIFWAARFATPAPAPSESA